MCAIARDCESDAECAGETNRVLANVALLVGVRRDIQRYVADDETAGIVGTDIIAQWLINRHARSLASFYITA